MLGSADRPLELVGQPSLPGGCDGRGQSLLRTGLFACRGKDFAGGHLLDHLPLRRGGLPHDRVQDVESVVRPIQGEESTRGSRSA
ncbi:hypothetical protein [Amycolatopsis mediterranei]|uniref:Uncharacterized protein n=1 Tax=Amycolatopsis mediterranei (strain S699) TaxID=713604 RepID=A0A9R0UCD2_AMYMS|nr:hypothetical protein [Amycolatopsis mediterranei]AEK45776.1 hypothetical protein RAM_36515 [Amycolatopsis mediterranei S699]KDU94056.1 hypothetical protein DV36_01575 [Amycolatopsis mediterranei]UZF73865.1 hypothetical protein ISP_007336 [Amycolatopsis mediterranei]